MKFSIALIALCITTIFTFTACNNSSDTNKQGVQDSVEISDSLTLPDAATVDPAPINTAPINPAPTNPTTAEPAQNAQGVWHFICSKGCTGGAGENGNCAKCGSTLSHNSAYHASTASPTTITPSTTQPSAEPAQNASGVWHYTCTNGCKGGAGDARACASCGVTLAHNQAYHQ